jgi:Zn-dependent protease
MLDLSPQTFISRIIILVIALTVHEFAHAKSADMFGDNTPRANGRLTLNPLKHLDPFGSLMMIFVGFGWARPVPVNPYALGRSSPAALMLVSLAGPLSNFLMAIFAAIPLRLGIASFQAPASFMPSAGGFLLEFMFINLLLTFFNLIPLAPLDGDKIADYFFPPSWQRILQSIRPYSAYILMFLLFVLPWMGFNVLGVLIYPPIQTIGRLLIGN